MASTALTYVDEMFGDEDLQITAVDVDIEEEYRNYIIPLYARLQHIERPTPDTVADEAIAAETASKELEFLHCDVTNSEKFEFQISEVKTYTQVEYNQTKFVIPCPKKEFSLSWKQRIDKYVRHLSAEIHDLASWYSHDVDEWTKSVLTECAKVRFHISSDEREYTQQRILYAMILEKKLYHKARLVGKQLSNLFMQVDNPTDGAWITAGEAGSICVESTSTRVFPVKTSLKFDAKNTTLLINMLFSRKPEVRASAKLDLTARKDDTVMKQVMAKPESALAIIVAEARLTPTEVMSMLFPLAPNGRDKTCVACEKAITMGTVVYHGKCAVTDWLTQYEAFRYDVDEGAIVALTRRYITPETRRKISKVLNLHGKLHKDVVISTGTEKTYWSRQDDGTLKRTQLLTRREEDVIGTHAWKVKHGFSPKR